MTMKILILAADSGTLERLNSLVVRAEAYFLDAEVTTSTIADLFFCIDSKNTHVIDTISNRDISEFDLVVFRAVAGGGNQYYEEALAVSIYCKRRGIAFSDECLSGGHLRARKLATMMILWAEGVPVPTTLSGPAGAMVENIEKVGLPAILKATAATHGDYNHKIDSADDIVKITASSPDKHFLLQSFIPNDGDYRILIAGHEFNIERRQAAAGRHVNNESAGGISTQVDSLGGLEQTLAVARVSAQAVGLDVAGIDIIVSPENIPYVIEVNRAPQITSEKEAAAWACGISGLLNG